MCSGSCSISSVSGSLTTLGHVFINGSRSLSPHFEFREKICCMCCRSLRTEFHCDYVVRFSLCLHQSVQLFDDNFYAERRTLSFFGNYTSNTFFRTNQNQTWCSQVFAPFFSNFILSRTDHVPVRDKIKFEKHGLSIAAWLVKVTSTAASEMYKSCTDIAGSAKSMAGGTVDDLQMAKPLSHRSPITMIFLV